MPSAAPASEISEIPASARRRLADVHAISWMRSSAQNLAINSRDAWTGLSGIAFALFERAENPMASDLSGYVLGRVFGFDGFYPGFRVECVSDERQESWGSEKPDDGSTDKDKQQEHG